jgi:hypothetical protein
MKRFLTGLIFCFLFVLYATSQKVYTLSAGEIIFQSALVKQNNKDINTNLRFTAAFHFGEYVHVDLGNHFGLFSGIGLRNVGFITNENKIRIKYRSYNLGIPLAFKLGSFKKNLYVFGGAEYEWMIHFKQKTFIDGEKIKYAKWFSNRTPAFIPSVFAGFQFPAGIQVKFKYYLDNYLNHYFKDGDGYNDYTGFDKTRVWYISMSFFIRNEKKNSSKQIPIEIANLF